MLKLKHTCFLLVGVFYGFWSLLPAQVVPQLAIFPHQISFVAEAGASDFEIKTDIKAASNQSFITTDFRLEQGDLVLLFNIPRLAEINNIKFYNLELQLIAENGKQYQAAVEEMYGDFPNLAENPLQEHEIRWAGILERVRPFQGHFKLIVWISVSGTKNIFCEQSSRPEFNFKKWWPHLLTSTAAAGLIASSFLVDTEPDHRFEPSALPNHTTSRIMRYSGLGLLAADAILFFLHRKKVRKDQRYYDQFCGNKGPRISVGPQFGLSSPGMQLTWNFGSKKTGP